MDLQMNCAYYTPVTKECVTTGEILSVKDTAFDFTKKRNIGEAMAEKHPQTQPFNGFDHNFVIDGCGFRKAATPCSSPGRTLALRLNGMQWFSGALSKPSVRNKVSKLFISLDSRAEALTRAIVLHALGGSRASPPSPRCARRIEGRSWLEMGSIFSPIL